MIEPQISQMGADAASGAYCPPDMDRMASSFGAACGHGALAACLGVPVALACAIGWPDGTRGWVNMPDMERALGLCEARFQIIGRRLPADGLAILQWLGPWTQPNVPPRVACMHRHWIAVRGILIWDANLQGWMPRAKWEEFVPDLLPPRATGWEVARGYEVQKKGGRS